VADRQPKIRDLSSRQRVLEAIAEFDRLNRDEFLARYGYDHARRYRIRYEGKLYDSKRSPASRGVSSTSATATGALTPIPVAPTLPYLPWRNLASRSSPMRPSANRRA